MSDHVIVEQIGSTLKLTLNRPDKKNALTNAMYGALADALQRADQDDHIRCIVLAGLGDSFTAGNDLEDFMSIAQGKGPEVRHVARFLESLAMADKPLVAAVQGLAVGIGTTMLLHCDVVCVTPQTKLTTPFVNLALVPEAASSLLLQARIGYVRAFGMITMGDAIDGPTAVQWGLARECVDPAQLESRALAIAAEIAAKPLGAVRASKRLMRDSALIASVMRRESDVFAQRLASPEAREAFQAFAERRKPDFVNPAVR